MVDEERVRVVDLDWRSVVVLFLAFIGMVALSGLLRTIPRTVTWVLIGSVLALALNPVIIALERGLHCNRALAVTALLAIILGSLAGLAYFVGPETVQQARALSDDIPEIVDELSDLPVIGTVLRNNDAQDRVEDWLSDLPDNLAGQTAEIENAARSIASGVLAGFVMLLIIITFLLDGHRLAMRMRRLVPVRHRERADQVGEILYRVIGRYFGGSVLVAVIHGLAILVVGIILGVPLTPLLAVWVAIWSLVPQIGGALGGIPFVLFALTQGPVQGVVAAVFFVSYLLFENHVLTPLIVGDAVDLSPPTTMVVAILGVAIAGVPGALIGIPFVGAAKALYIELKEPERAERERVARLEKHVPVWMFWKKRHVLA